MSSWIYAAAAVIAAVLAIMSVVIVRRLAIRWNILDRPSNQRKIHLQPVPLLGGLAVYIAVALPVLGLALFSPWLIGQNLSLKTIIGVLIAGLVIVLIGAVDDKKNLPPRWQIAGPLIAIAIMIVAGLGIAKITNPFGGVIILNQWTWVVGWWHGVPATVTLWADLFTVTWLLGMMYTTKLLDGLDGLVSGLGTIGALMVFLLSSTTQWYQPDTALLAAVVVGACFGFTVWNWHPAKIFLGEGGSLLIGFFLGVLAIISGGKIATALLIMGIPILDVVWVIARRMLVEHTNPFRAADRKHFHFRLLDAGLSQRQAVIVFYLCALIFGSLTLVLQSQQKIIALGVLVIVMIILGVIVVGRTRQRQTDIRS